MSARPPSRAVLRALLGYLVADVGAAAGGVFALRPDDHPAPWRLAQTDSFDQAGDSVALLAWTYRRGPLVAGRTVAIGRAVVIPLRGADPADPFGLLVLLEGGVEGLTAFQRSTLDRLAGLVRLEPITPPQNFERLPPPNHREQLEAALTMSQGIVAHAARLLGRPARTVWDQLRRHGITARSFKPGAGPPP